MLDFSEFVPWGAGEFWIDKSIRDVEDKRFFYIEIYPETVYSILRKYSLKPLSLRKRDVDEDNREFVRELVGICTDLLSEVALCRHKNTNNDPIERLIVERSKKSRQQIYIVKGALAYFFSRYDAPTKEWIDLFFYCRRDKCF